MPSSPQSVPLIRVYDYLLASSGPSGGVATSRPGRTVSLSLAPATAQASSIAPTTQLPSIPLESTVTDGNGYWEIWIVPVDNINPSGMTYIVDDGYRTYKINPKAAGIPGIGWQSSAILVSTPQAPVGVGGNFLPGGTTVLGSFLVQGLFDAQGQSQFDQYVKFGQGPIIDITHPAYGAKGDARWVTDGAITSGQTSFTSSSLTQADVGKLCLVAGAGPVSAASALIATIQSVVGTTATLSVAATNTVAAANTCIGTDNHVPIQAAINQQQTAGGRLRVPLDSFGGKYLMSAPNGYCIFPAPGVAPNGFTSATRDLIIEGDGMNAVSLIAGGPCIFDGVLGYTTVGNPALAKVICSDLAFDGNYLGVANGVFNPVGAPGQGALVAISWPYTTITGAVRNGLYHEFTRVRFYRPSGFTFQGTQGIQLVACVFDQVGQPDQASGATHYDNLGSSEGDAIVQGCTWLNSSGNYADFVGGVAGHPPRLIFQGNKSFNHQIGGIYACGTDCVITDNNLSNNVAGSGIGYDVGTAAANRARNLVAGNVLENLLVNASGLSDVLYGDMVYGNTSPDTAAVGINGMWQGGMLFGIGVQSIAYAASITPDFTKGSFVKVGTLTGNITINNPATNFAGSQNSLTGMLVIFQFTQDGAGIHTVSFGSAFKGNNPQVSGRANDITYIVFMADGAGNFFPLTAFPTSSTGQSSNLSVSQSVGMLGFNSFVGGGFPTPNIQSDGTSLYYHANAAGHLLRPQGNNNQNMLSGSAGSWTTYDSGGTARNSLDDGSGNIAAKGAVKPGNPAIGFTGVLQLFSGSGVPSNSNGNNGDMYLRSDTPATANQRIYNRQAGVWTGIL